MNEQNKRAIIIELTGNEIKIKFSRLVSASAFKARGLVVLTELPSDIASWPSILLSDMIISSTGILLSKEPLINSSFWLC